MSESREFESVACGAARAAGCLLRSRFRERGGLTVETKGLHDFVTEVDRQAETIIVDHIRSRYPDHAVMAEEGSPDAGRATYRWVVDPLDGTTNFIHGVSPFSVSIALEDDSGLLAAAIHDPFHDETFHACRNGGARLNDEPIRCPNPNTAEQALIATGFPFRELTRLGRYMQAFESVIRTTAGLRRAGSAAIDLAYTACGRYDGFFEIGLSRWDIAAGVLIVQEAGGTVTDVVGGARHLETGDILAAGPSLHGILLEIMRAAFD